jgi:serine/threonine-protein kinase HipA
MEKEVFVYMELASSPILVGRLWVRARKQKESASFEYDRAWLDHSNFFALEPSLMHGMGVYHTIENKSIFGALGDSAPDRWGRTLMRRAERQRAASLGESPRTLLEVDYLLRVNDQSRMGALRFAEKLGGPFLAEPQHAPIPPLLDLPQLLNATQHVCNDSDSSEDLKLLLAPGSSLGGARPKASVLDKNGNLMIAKFQVPDDEYSIVLWEGLALSLAKKCGIRVPEFTIETINKSPVLLSKRFDRHLQIRIPFLSAMSMLGLNDNDRASYLDIADCIRQSGADPIMDLRELWSRMLFNIMIANTDDHLRNHAFLYEIGRGWRLSPAYDLNPVPMDIKPRILSTYIDAFDGTGTLEHALSVAEYFELTPEEAKSIIESMITTLKTWKKVASSLGIKSSEIERMSSAFLSV